AQGSYASAVFLVTNAVTLSALWLGTDMVVSGAMTVGSLAAFGMYTHNLGESVADLTEGIAGIIKARGAGGRLFSLLGRTPLLIDGHGVPSFPLQGKVEFKDIDFS
ncbi:unnamed protein product, partial [Discosporangium mesarthrocarpum]